jgi:hypothetical protein
MYIEEVSIGSWGMERLGILEIGLWRWDPKTKRREESKLTHEDKIEQKPGIILVCCIEECTLYYEGCVESGICNEDLNQI